MFENQDSIQLLNTAIIKSKENKLKGSYEERLTEVCSEPALQALSVAISHLSETQSISRDQAALNIIEAVRSLDGIWQDYVMMEGITKLKEMLEDHSPQ